MPTKVYLGFEPRSGTEIPRPARPGNDDVNPSAYIPKGMTPKDREALRNAGREWTDTLGLVKGGAIGWAAGDTYKRAGQNISHYRHGGGAAVDLNESEVGDLRSQTTLFSAIEREFITLIGDDMRGRGVGIQRHYLAMNGNSSSPNAGTAWFGAYAKQGTGWYYAMGGFLLGFGAFTKRNKDFVAIWYRSYVYDRYNWDPGKETTVPSEHLSYLLNDSVMGKIAGLTGPDGMRYFRSASAGKDAKGKPVLLNQDTKDRSGKVDGYTIGEKYIASDSLLGALEESGDAKRYDINGAGRVTYISVPV